MTRFILRRLGLGLVALALVSGLVFATAELLPGDVGRTILGPYATNEQVTQLDHQLGVDRPLPVRYVSWVSDFARGDWGHSNLLNQDVLPLVFDRLVNSLILGLFALILVVPLSVGLGVLAALRRGRPLDRLITIGGLVVIETIFNYPGIGKLLVDSAVGHDLPVLEGCVMATALLNIISNLTADVVYALLNPRIRLASAA
jgi:peptide/nickel transport system permease protein